MTSITTHPTLQERIAVISRGDADRAQNIYLALLERERADPEFSKKQLGYHVKYAKWTAQHDIEHAVIYNKYVECEAFVAEEDGTEASVFDTLIADDELTPEEQLELAEQRAEARQKIEAVRSAIPSLPKHQRRIAELLMQGLAPCEIAKKLGTSKANVSQITAKMRRTLAATL